MAQEWKRLKAVEVSGELFLEWITEGYKTGGPFYVTECLEGLPEGVSFVSVQYDVKYGLDPIPLLLFIFEHPDFDIVRPGDEIPRVAIKHGRHRWEP
jgi:hypothetical protein